ncbi:MAG: APC family permease [Acetobacteraceae bacterium]|nr:APC family permease [Acetobacteraceae bacterium]
MEVEKLYTRKATGLVRQIGTLTAVLIAVCNVVGLGWQKRVFQAAGWTPVAESQYFLGIHPVTMAFLLAGIVILISLYCYAMLSAAMPKSGGGYIHISRIISPGWGFVATWMQFWSVAVSYGLIAVATLEAVWLFGGLAGISLPGWLTSPYGLFLSGLVVVAIFSTIACFGVRLTGYLLQVMFWIPAVILVCIYFIFIAANPGAMEQGFMALFNHAPVEYTQAAIAQGMADIAAKNSYWGAVASAILAAYWAYIGYAAATFVAGEVKEAHRTLPRAMFTSGVVIILIYMTISFLMARAARMIGQVGDFSVLSAIGFMNFGGGSFADANLPKVGGWMPVIAAMQAAGMGMNWVMPLLVVFAALWVANDIPPFILTTSRMIFAMAFDRLLPRRLADVNQKWHSPVNAIIFVSCISVLFGCTAESDLFSSGGIKALAFLNPIIGSAGAIAATDLWDIFFFTVVAVAALMFPFRKPEIFERSPFRVSKTWTTVLAALAVAGNIWMFLVVAFHKHGWNLLGLNSWKAAIPLLFSIGLGLAGYIIYAYYSNVAKRTGVELTTIFTELPPD